MPAEPGAAGKNGGFAARSPAPLNDQAALLGLSVQSRSTIARYRRGEPLADNADLLARRPPARHPQGAAHHVPARPRPRPLTVTTPNRRFAGARPIDIKKRNYEENSRCGATSTSSARR